MCNKPEAVSREVMEAIIEQQRKDVVYLLSQVGDICSVCSYADTSSTEYPCDGCLWQMEDRFEFDKEGGDGQ